MSACWTPPPDADSSQRQQNQSSFPPCTHLVERPPAQTPRAHPSRSPPAGSTQSRTPELEHKCKRFYFRTFDCSLSEGWRCVGSSSGHGTRLNGTWQSAQCPRRTGTCPEKRGPLGSGERGCGWPPSPGSTGPAAERQNDVVSKGMRQGVAKGCRREAGMVTPPGHSL